MAGNISQRIPAARAQLQENLDAAIDHLNLLRRRLAGEEPSPAPMTWLATEMMKVTIECLEKDIPKLQSELAAMGSGNSPKTTALIAKLLAPLSASEALDEKRALMDLRKDMMEVWYRRGGTCPMADIDRAGHMRKAVSGYGPEFDIAWRTYLALVDRQMLTPAPGKEQLKCKRRRNPALSGIGLA